MRDRKPKDINNVITSTKSNGAIKIQLLTMEKGVLYQTKKKHAIGGKVLHLDFGGRHMHVCCSLLLRPQGLQAIVHGQELRLRPTTHKVTESQMQLSN